MNSDGLAILDQSLRWSLWVFLGVFGLLLLWQVGQLKARQAATARRHGTEGLPPAAQLGTTSQIRLAYRTFLLALGAAGLAVAGLTLAPLPFVDNFVTTNSWRETPLRVTSIKPDRTATGFSLSGEFWNQTEETLEGVVVVVRVWGNDDKVLDEVTTSAQPASLAPNSSATFEVSYGKNAPFISGYQLAFQNPDGDRIPHVNGFDVRR